MGLTWIFVYREKWIDLAEKVDMDLIWIFICRKKWIDLAEKIIWF